MDRVFVCVLVVASCVACVSAYGESASDGLPVWQERANHVLVNAVRLNPSAYKSIYMSGYSPDVSGILTSTYPAVGPVYLAPQLVASASNHSVDMVISGKFQHDSSDGTATFTRVKSFYTCSGTLAENIAAGNADPIATNNQWLCDKTGSACAADGSSSDGHRRNIMGKSYKAIGVGFAYGASSAYKNYWTQDFGGATCNPAATTPVYGGSHVFSGSNIKYITTLYTSAGTAPSSAKVVTPAGAYDLTYELGVSQGQGHYAYTQAKGSACRNYYFEFVVSGVTYRYPDTGFLVTYGEGTCTISFTAASASTSAPTTTTSAPTTTNAPATTTNAPTTTTNAPTTTTNAPTTTTNAPTTTTNTPTTTTNAPTTTTSAPTTSAPTTSAPTTSAPTTSAPTTTTPTPTTSAPTTTTSAPTTTASPTTTTSAPTTTTTTRQATTTTTASGDTFISDVLAGHNAARALVGQSNLVWNTTIANIALNYANQCNFAHNSNRGPYGENIYAASGAVKSTTGKSGTASWVSEKQYYNCTGNSCASGKVCGHYTQVIWASTSQIGCAAVTCTTNSPFGSSFPTWNFMVCDYAKPGNYVGQRPVSTTSC